MSMFPTGESGERGTTPPRDIKVRRITAVLLCQHTHTHSLSELSARTFTVSDKFRHFLECTTARLYPLLGQVKERALWENFPFVCGLRGFLLLICSSVIYGVMNGEGLEGLIAQESATFQAEIG
ncbi:hypothetical protein QQF64_012361 [Cirrhinus molitorella]|uniref:Uncharacterized protein n=1 Tax=Cirrhinus molitorella TaxID=172907 RepID=A0ABR3LXQ9_9TELE